MATNSDHTFRIGDAVQITDVFPAWSGRYGRIISISSREGNLWPYWVRPDDGNKPIPMAAHEMIPALDRSLPPQTEMILDHLKRVGSISNVEAQALYRARALPKRVSEIRRAGYPIRKEWKRDATGQRHVRYHLVRGGIDAADREDVGGDAWRYAA